MFENKKLLKQIEKEKQELLFIKSQLESIMPKVDISNVYVWDCGGVSSIVRLVVRNIHGKNGFGTELDGYKSTLIDIFTNQVVYELNSVNLIKEKQYISKDNYAYFYKVHEIDHSLLAYADKKVPLYVLQELYFKLNNVDVIKINQQKSK